MLYIIRDIFLHQCKLSDSDDDISSGGRHCVPASQQK